MNDVPPNDAVPPAEGADAGHAEPQANAAQREQRQQSQASVLVEAVLALEAQGRCKLFKCPILGPCISLTLKGRREVVLLKSRQAQELLSGIFFAARRTALREEPIKAALRLLSAHALHERAEELVYVRIARVGRVVYLDLADEDGRVVVITERGWEVKSDVPVHFWRPPGMEPLPAPEKSGTLADFRVGWRLDGDHLHRALAFLLGALRGVAPYPMLDVQGTAGSGKSTLCRLLKRTIDPRRSDRRSPPRDGRDLAIAGQHDFLPVFDNLSHLSGSLSDDFCRFVEGTVFTARQLYTDSDEVALPCGRPVILNGITSVVEREDLLDRTVVLELEALSTADRASEEEVLSRFEALRPRMLGLLLDAAARALAEERSVVLPWKPRNVDWGRWIVAAAPALGLEPNALLDSVRASKDDADQIVLDACPFYSDLMREIKCRRGMFSGTAQSLLDLINILPPVHAHPKGWPTSPSQLSSELKCLEPILACRGIIVTRSRKTDHTRERIITITLPDAPGRAGGGTPSGK